MRLYVLYGFGILLCIAGIGYLSAEYIRYLSDLGKLLALLLTTGMFGFLGKFFEEQGMVVMGIVVTIAVLASLFLFGWLLYRAFRGKQVKAHHVAYGIAIVTGIFTYGYFLSLNLPQPVKILASIILGVIFIIVAAIIQRGLQKGKA